MNIKQEDELATLVPCEYEERNMCDLFNIDYLKSNELMIGSRYLNVDVTPETDWDFVIFLEQSEIEEFRKSLNSIDGILNSVENYFDVLPLHNSMLCKFIDNNNNKIDLIIMTDVQDYIILTDSYRTLSLLPECLYRKKEYRIAVLEMLLMDKGWFIK